MALTPRQQAFVDAYQGNGTEAARVAGYAGDAQTLAVTASRLLKHAKVDEAIKRRNVVVATAREQAVEQAGRIATRAERQAFWTKVMLAEAERTTDRLKAAELLGRSEADFTDKLDVTARVTLEELLAKAGG